MTQATQVLIAIRKATGALTSAQIKTLTGLTSEQVRQATSILKRQGKINPKNPINIKVKAFNRWQDEPQRWIIADNEHRRILQCQK